MVALSDFAFPLGLLSVNCGLWFAAGFEFGVDIIQILVGV